MTFVANTALTAAQLNTFLRDNLNETAPAKATAAGQWFVSTTDNSIAARNISSASNLSGAAITSTSYTDGNGPTLTLLTGQYAMVTISAQMKINVANESIFANYVVTGATTISTQDSAELVHNCNSANTYDRTCSITWCNLTPGTNTFTMKYRVSTNSGGATSGIINARLTVLCL